MTQREVESDQDGLMSYGTCHTLPPAVPLSSWIPLAPFVALHRIRGFQRLEFREFVPAPACVYFLRVSLVIRCTAHCHLQCVSANLANRASHTSFNRLFSRGHDPFAHACKARPLTIVGWTSLSVSLSLSEVQVCRCDCLGRARASQALRLSSSREFRRS